MTSCGAASSINCASCASANSMASASKTLRRGLRSFRAAGSRPKNAPRNAPTSARSRSRRSTRSKRRCRSSGGRASTTRRTRRTPHRRTCRRFLPIWRPCVPAQPARLPAHLVHLPAQPAHPAPPPLQPPPPPPPAAPRPPAAPPAPPRPPASAPRPPAGHAGASHRPDHHDGAAYLPTIPAGLEDLPEPKPAPEPLMFDGELDFGGPPAAAPRSAGRRPDKPSLPPPAATPPAPAPPAQEFVPDPDLEETAIRFANGDHAGTETRLLEVLAQPQQDAPEQQLGIWMTLFDLYRAIGQHDRFDNLSIDFAARYSRSAPLWFSMPGQLGLVVEQHNAAAVAMRHDFHWNAPATLAVSSVAALHASLMRAASPWALSWARLTSIDEAAVPLLADHLGQWAHPQGQFLITALEKLNALLRAKTPSGERSGNPEWWRLRMAALRLMGLADEFELVALEYCVTYEVSPPSWVAPRCAYSDNEGVTSGTPGQPADGTLQEALDLQAAGSASPAPAAQDGDNPPVARLSGHVDGDATHLLEPMQQFMRPGVPFTIARDKLIRMDFTAVWSQPNLGALLHFCVPSLF